ncbi:RNA polymerase sigma factor [Nocardia thailandica]|uniref:RNA polymerase sigma factor n=1 Tax=Nocardia thailandica TaxID=257275 RepID=A0ABW6PNY8_9NOCA
MSDISQDSALPDDPIELAAIDPALYFETRTGVPVAEAFRLAYRVAYSRIGSGSSLGEDRAALAEDIAQEAMIAIWAFVRDPRNEVREGQGLIVRITTNKFLDRCRAHKRDRVDRTVRDNSATVLALADTADTAVQALARQMIAEIEAWIPGLPQHLREVAELMWDRDSVSFDLLTYVDAAEQLGINVGTLKSRLHTLRKLFCQHFSEKYRSERPQNGTSC